MASNRVVHIAADDDGVQESLRGRVTAIQQELDVTPQFPPEVEAAAKAAAEQPRLPDLDRTDLPFVTIDPEGSTDLDQALHLQRDPDDATGYLVHYAIADLAAFVDPGGPIDAEAHRRGETLYGGDSRVPLHPTVLSEGAASLLPDQLRPALLWTIRVDGEGEGIDIHVERARVRSRAQLTYVGVQAALDDGSADESLLLLRELGAKRLAREAARGGVSLPLPEQEVSVSSTGEWSLHFRSQLPVEQWNAQISLLTGFGAASLMVYARVGLLRTLPPPDPRDVQRLHRTARALGLDWPAEQLYPDFVRTLDPSVPAEAAMVVACTRLLRGSGYVAFDGEVPEQPQHAALASEYAHVTAPLRRLADRYAGEVCVALCAGTEVPDWVHVALPGLPAEMRTADQRAKTYERSVIDLVEAGLLQGRVGEEFDGVVTAVSEHDRDHAGTDAADHGTVMVSSLGVEAPVHGAHDLPLGHQVRVRLETADLDSRTVRFALV